MVSDLSAVNKSLLLVASYLARSDLTNQIPDFIRLAEERLARDLRTRKMLVVARADTTASDSTVGLPTDFLEMRDMHLRTTPVQSLTYRSPNAFYAGSRTTDSGKPIDYTILASEIQFAPGCFDDFDGTQEELQEMIAQLHKMLDDGTLFEHSEPVAVQANQPVAYTKPRSPIVNKATYLEHSVRAALGNDESKLYVRAADDTTSNNAGLVPTRQLTEIINPLSNADRPAVDSVSRGVLPDAGMTFEIPKITVVPTITS